MIKLIDLLKEQESVDPSLKTDLDSIDDIIKAELEQVAQSQNEAILTTVSIALAVPGIVKSLVKVVESIAKKRGINLKKKNDPSWYKVIGTVAENIDNYLDAPIRLVLKPFISDEQRRKQVAGILKAVVLSIMSIMGSVDINNIVNVKDTIIKLGGETGKEIVQAITQNSLPKVIDVVKKALV